MKFNHGIAFQHDINVEYKQIVKNTIELVEGKHPNWTLSCSREDQYLGKIGFVCTGICIEMYDSDCGSHYDVETGKRYTDNRYHTQCNKETWYASDSAYTEAFVTEVKVIGLWMEERFYRLYLRNRSKCVNKAPDEYTQREEMFAEIEKLVSLGLPLELIHM